MQKLEFVEKNEILYDYVLMQYEPKKNNLGKGLFQKIILKDKNKKSGINLTNKLRISNIFFKSIENFNNSENFILLTNELRNEIGINQTVWGIKNINGKLGWELYFYRHLNKEKVSLIKIIEIFKNYLSVNDIQIDENLPYIMFSFDIDEEMSIEDSNIYFGKYFGDCFHAWSYTLNVNESEFLNHYETFSPQSFHLLIDKILSSPFINSKINISDILFPDFMNCRFIWISSKRKTSGIYYQGINLKQFVYFLEKFDYPADLVSFVKGHKKQLDYILFDVGFDYSVENGKLVFGKSGFYGTL